MTKKTDDNTNLQLPEAKHGKVATPADFADKVQELQNHAYQQSQVEGEHQQRFADWCNALGDLWRQVKQHA